MAISPFKTFSSGEVLTASDLNSSITQITNNGTAVAFPLTASSSAGNFNITSLALGVNATDAASVQNVLNAASKDVVDFRLTLTTVTPVTSADVLAATTVFLSPYKGNLISLYDGSANWNVRTSAEMSIAVPATTSQMYDVFCYDNAGTPTLEALAWTNDTTRATALVLQNGVLVKSGATTRRYIGSFRTTTVSGQTEDSRAKRYVWNYYNRVRRQMGISVGLSWTYTGTTVRQANGGTTVQLDFVIGVAEDAVEGSVQVMVQNTNTGVSTTVGIGVNVTNAITVGQFSNLTTAIANGNLAHRAAINYVPAIGRTFLSWNESSAATGTTTWTPASAGSAIATDMYGSVMG